MQANLDAKGHERDLMHIKVDALRGLAVICGGDAAGTAAALETIVAVDSVSEEVTLIQARKIHADVMVEGFAMHLATCAQVSRGAAVESSSLEMRLAWQRNVAVWCLCGC